MAPPRAPTAGALRAPFGAAAAAAALAAAALLAAAAPPLAAAAAVDVTVTALNPGAWMGTLVPYWEGPIRIEGSHPGRGYLEMTGY